MERIYLFKFKTYIFILSQTSFVITYMYFNTGLDKHNINMKDRKKMQRKGEWKDYFNLRI